MPLYTCTHRLPGPPPCRPRFFTRENIGSAIGGAGTRIDLHQAVVEKQSRNMERLRFSAENAEAIKKGRSTELALEWSNVARRSMRQNREIIARR